MKKSTSKQHSRHQNSSRSSHASPQKSTTLKRQYVSRPKISIDSVTSPANKNIDILAAEPLRSILQSAPISSSKDALVKTLSSAGPADLSHAFAQPATPPEEIAEIEIPEPTQITSHNNVSHNQNSNHHRAPRPAPVSQPYDLGHLFSDITTAIAANQPSAGRSAIDSATEPLQNEPIDQIELPESSASTTLNVSSASTEGEIIPPPTPRELKNEAVQKALNQLEYEKQQEQAAVERVIAEEATPSAPIDDVYSAANTVSDNSALANQFNPPAAENQPSRPDSSLEKSFRRKRRRSSLNKFILAFATSAICIGILGYFVGINMPSISVRVAAMQTGIEAAYPNYVPRGYQLSGVSTQEGHIIINFIGEEEKGFNITEEKTSWDSTALLNNYVKVAWDDYDTLREQGLTIYTYDSNAAWINGSTLYRIINRGAPLTKKQIKNIAISLQ